MARVRCQPLMGGSDDPKKMNTQFSQAIDGILEQVNGKLTFGDNISSQTVEVEFPQANVDVKVNHDLGRTASVYIVGRKSAVCDVYDGIASWTKSQVYVRSNTAGVTVTLILS